MKLQTAKCTVCGASLKLEVDKTISECSYCKSQIIVSNALDFNKVEVDKSKDIIKYRDNLKKYVRNNSIEEILRVSSQILDILPKDFLATYFAAYAHQVRGEPNYIYEFYSNILEHTPPDLETVVEHINKRSDLRDKQRITSFLEKIDQSKTQSYLDAYEARQAEEDNFADIPRDVFICHSSKNLDIAKKVVERLENDGNTCWVSYRNLRPNDTDNYWSNIKQAIDKCAIFLVISDLEAMRSKDVQAELSYAQERVNRKVEFKIDDKPHTQLFKHVFDGIKWVEGVNLKKGLEALTERIFEEKEVIKDLISKKQWKGYVQPSYQVLSPKTKKLGLIIGAGVLALALLVGFSLTNRTPVDTAAPIIQLSGSTNMSLTQGDIYNEPGAIVSDNVDIGLDPIITGSVNTNVIGTYTIKYNATDNAGNKAVEKTRTVTILPSNTDTTKPVIRLNGDSSITLEVKSSFNDPLASVSDNKDINVNLITSGVVNTGVLGTYTLRYNAIDNAGNRADEVVRTVRVVDTTKPVVTLIGSSTVRVKQGETYTEPGMNVSDNYDSSNQIQQTISGSVNISTVGTYTLTYTARDSSGNISTPVQRQVIVETVTVDSSNFNNATTFVTLDINPSIGLTLNSSDQVVEVFGINQDGKSVLSGLTLAGTSFNTALSSLIQSASSKGYVASTDAILIGIESNNEAKRNTLETSARSIISTQANNLGKSITTQVEKTTLDVTKAVNVINGLETSSAKTKLITEVSSLTNSSFNANAASNIKDLINRKEQAAQSAIIYTITYNLNSGTNPSGSVTSFNTTQLPLTLPVPTRAGFNFQGWYESIALSGDPVTQIPTGTNENKRYFAKWSGTDYLISYVLNDGTLPANVRTSFNATNLPYTLPTPTRSGYTFNGWFENSNLTGSAVTLVPTSTTTNKTYHAKWTMVTYTITYNLNSGTNPSGSVTSFNTTQLPLTLPVPTRAGFNFQGWYESIALSGDPVTQIPTGTNENKRYFAKWSLVELKQVHIDIKSVSVGHSTSSVLSHTGEIFSWGSNGVGQIGIKGASNDVNSEGLTPTNLPLSIFKLDLGEKITLISRGASHSSALTNNGRVFTWGYNFSGQLGNGNKINQMSPVDITSNFNLVNGDKINYISLGEYHSSAISTNGRVFMWGNNEHGQLGLSFKASSPSDGQVLPVDMTSMFSLRDNDKIKNISIGWGHTLALSENARVFAYGYNKFGQLGTSSNFPNNVVPYDITSQFNLNVNEYIVSVNAGYDHSSAITNIGRLFLWGSNSTGQLGDGTIMSKNKPTTIKYFDDRTDLSIIKVSSGIGRTAVITTDGQLLVWGSNYFGQLGDGSKNDSYIPINITANFILNYGEKITSISGGYAHSLVVTSQNRLFVWGNNGVNRLGIKNLAESLLPIELIILN